MKLLLDNVSCLLGRLSESGCPGFKDLQDGTFYLN